MLSEKPWRVETVLRLFLGVILCVMLGSLVTAIISFLGKTPHAHAWLFGPLTVASALCSVAALTFLRRPWDLDSLTSQLGTFLLCLYLGLALGMFALKYAGTGDNGYPAWRVTISAISLQGSAILLTFPFAREHGLTWAEAFGFKNRWPGAVLWGGLVTIIFMPIGLGLQGISIKVMSLLGHEATSQLAVQALTQAQTWSDRIALGVTAIVLAPIAEEIIFRGILYPTIKRLGYPRLALWGTSLFFAAIHANVSIFLPLLVLALALALLYEKTNNLLAPILAHALFNAINFAMFFLDDRIGQWLQHHS